ncbi:MAG TPA: PP2C family serine/threonine-protein phosphatase [Stenomitos sp.]
MGWQALSRSAIGTRHQSHHLPCQDAGGYRTIGNLLIGAIADGAGSAPHSALGATLAVESTLNYLDSLEQWLQPGQPQWPTLERAPSLQQAQRLFQRTAHHVRAALQQTAEQNGYGLEELACTLLAVVATPHWLAAMQIGDGFIVTSTAQETYQLLFQPAKGEFANQTTFITSPTAFEDLEVITIDSPPQFICAATDAFERLALHLPQWKPHAPFFNPLTEYLAETLDPETDDEYIVNFLSSDYLNKQTDDDKTLLLCRYVS